VSDVIRDDANKLSAMLQERFGGEDAEVSAAVVPQSTRIEFTAPGGARPHLIRYNIKVAGAGRVALLDLEEAEALLGSLPVDGAGIPDRVFGEIASRGLSVEALD
jgi:hypothetical protein